MATSTSEISTFVKSYWSYFLELEDEFKQTQKYVAFDLHNKKTYSVEYLKLIQAVCSEIDVVAKEIANHFDTTFSSIQHPTIKHWGFVISQNMPRLSSYKISFNDEIELTPWHKFGYVQGVDTSGRSVYKLAPRCKTLSWWSDYNKMKHERTTLCNGQMNFTKANLNNMMNSFGALYALETLYMSVISPKVGPDCNIPESQLFHSNIIPQLMELRCAHCWGTK